VILRCLTFTFAAFDGKLIFKKQDKNAVWNIAFCEAKNITNLKIKKYLNHYFNPAVCIINITATEHKVRCIYGTFLPSHSLETVQLHKMLFN